ncbi:MAG TPA: TetR/AcrR family transcriptional regulator [Bacteroidales bacterium]|nr:TetR/AcrR family transcriptional regulator [Bacteroidales bacterium]HRZ48163.1 TetR/AcrR family transcriptional regulator [Bacteroidales bacterium]
MTEHDKLTEEKIFESATEVFLDKGMDGARMQDIANHAGINKALLHYYYRTKDRLFDMVFEKIAGLMFKKFAPVFDETLTLDDKIRFFFREHITFLQKNPRLPLFILNELNRNPARMRRLLENIPVKTLWEKLEDQHPEEIKAMNLTREKIPQLMTTIASMSVFPFAARSVIGAIMEKAGYDFDRYIEERKDYAAEFVIAALKNPKDNPTI